MCPAPCKLRPVWRELVLRATFNSAALSMYLLSVTLSRLSENTVAALALSNLQTLSLQSSFQAGVVSPEVGTTFIHVLQIRILKFKSLFPGVITQEWGLSAA